MEPDSPIYARGWTMALMLRRNRNLPEQWGSGMDEAKGRKKTVDLRSDHGVAAAGSISKY